MQPLPPPRWWNWFLETIRIPIVFGTVTGSLTGAVILLTSEQFKFAAVGGSSVGVLCLLLAIELWGD